MWERGWSFIKKAGTIILLSTILAVLTERKRLILDYSLAELGKKDKATKQESNRKLS